MFERYVQNYSCDSPLSEPLVKSNDNIVGGECYDPSTHVQVSSIKSYEQLTYVAQFVGNGRSSLQ